ncbi:MAG: zinc-ribbon and FHA domain-containing protein [Thermoleophilia bacterium]|nr:zinc-ribbon and FHA domain-containing protein [Thermoleophilia bacterium]
MHVHCPECGFQNLEAAKYCEKCGALLIPDDGGETTMSFSPGETVEDVLAALPELGPGRVGVVVRLGGGRAGETYALERDLLTIGRHPDCDIFLDDVTVSRRHARLVRRGSGYAIEDEGSLNGTFVNRRRVDSQLLEDGDEVQIGKYKLTFLTR